MPPRSGVKSSITCTSVNRVAHRVCPQALYSAKSSSRPQSNRARREWFVAGTESSAASTTNVTTISMPTAEAAARVVTPADGTVIAPTRIFRRRANRCWCAPTHRKQRALPEARGRPLAPCGVREVMVQLPPPGSIKFAWKPLMAPAGAGHRWKCAASRAEPVALPLPRRRPHPKRLLKRSAGVSSRHQ